jgi:hypothetical protein
MGMTDPKYDFEYVSFTILDKDTQTAFISTDKTIKESVLHNVYMNFDEHSNLVLSGTEVEVVVPPNYQWYYGADRLKELYHRRKKFYEKYKDLVEYTDIYYEVYTEGSLWYKREYHYMYIKDGVTLYIDTDRRTTYTFKNYTIRQFENMT